MGALQPWHLIVILVIVLMVFGPGKLPDLGRSLGEGMRELKKASAEAASTDGPASAAAASTAADRCSSCSSPVVAGAKFCGSCGADFNGSAAHSA